MENPDKDTAAGFVADLDGLDQIISLGLWHWTAGTEQLVWSKQLYKILGLDPTSFEPNLARAFEKIHPDDRDATMAKLFGVAAHKAACEHEFRIIHADGEVRVCWAKVRPVIENDTAVAVRGTVLDVTYLREREAQADESEENYRHFIELSPQTPWTADGSGNVLTMGANWTVMTGRSTEEALGAGWLQSIHPDDLVVAGAMIEDAQAERSIDCRYRLLAADGTHRWLRTRAYPRRDAHGAVIRWYGLSEDIHEQVEAEERLRESEEHHRYSVELSPQIAWTADEHGNINDFGPLWCELMGMAREDVLGRGWIAAVHPEDVASALDVWSSSLKSGRPVDVRYRLRQANCEYRWFRARAQPRRGGDGKIIRWYGVLEDVDDQVRAEAALSRAEERYRLATQATNDLIWDWDVITDQIEWTHSLVDGFGYRSDELGTDLAWWGEHIHPEDRVATLTSFQRALDAGEPQFVCEYRFRRADGSYALVCDRGYVVRDKKGRAVRAVGAIQDLSERKQAEEKARWGANHDFLTELPNRRLFQERLDQALACAAARGRKVGLLHLDVDHFKSVNDALGHGAGDALLRTLATRLREVTRSTDTVARLGGDEFAIILADIQEEEDLPALVEAILARMREPFSYDGRILDCRTSIGASVYPLHGKSPEVLLKNADTALYSAKSAGRGGLMIFQPEMREEVQKRSLMISRARDALGQDQIFPHYQPKIDLRTGRVSGFEALLRWRDPAGELRLPAEVSAAFDDLELAQKISERMLDRTVRDAVNWLKAGVPFGHVAVNAAAAEFRQDNFAERVLKKLADAGLPTSRFQIEVTETVFLGRGSEAVERSLNLLSGEGVTIALDDFGTGYASLRHLKQFPVDVLKIDQSFVQGLQNGLGDAAIIDAVIKLGQTLHISTVAEGIETVAQADRLRSSGCDYGQGFLYSKAVPAENVPSLITSLAAIHSPKEPLQAIC